MIRRPTAFVIGAGASCSYGLPASAGLIQSARALTERHNSYQLLLAAGTGAGDLNNVLADLKEHAASSLDAFLETRQQHELTMTVGRRLIAILMAEAIIAARLYVVRTDDDWLAYIIGRMHPGAPDCTAFAAGNSGARFVTFNFDTFIEERLEKAIRSIYRGAAVRRRRGEDVSSRSRPRQAATNAGGSDGRQRH